MSIKRRMDKEVVHIYNGRFSAIKSNTFELVIMRWVNVEPVIQSEVNQKEKDKYHILTYIWNLEKWY